ncbi:MAG TPA: ligase-associated DNA damage response DEXH box helicase [Stellaceae bacterium]|nr:ligase-associated DNA damage response DEXH box helicase [Stellaceae bacterium]
MVPPPLPPRFAQWFARRGWTPHAHQLALLQAAREGRSALLVAPTGGGKTLAGFLPSLVDLAETPGTGLHTLYISPLKALAVDIHRNLAVPVGELALPIRLETRTGDTPHKKRERQRSDPPDMLMTTPESLALLLSYPAAPQIFAGLKAVIIDELHALAGSKRGDLLSLGLARLVRLAPTHRRIGLSATVAWPDDLAAYLSYGVEVARIGGSAGAEPEVGILDTGEPLPWAGHMAMHAIPAVYDAIKQHRTTLVFVNTRAQAELAFQALWRLNDENLPIGLHHGSLAVEQRRKIEAAMAEGRLRAVVATSSLDLGIDWGNVDLVVQLGAPKGVSRLIQRIGRANHRLNEPSRALLVPGNRFEELECRAALAALRAHELDGDRPRAGSLDVLAQHVMGMACAQPFAADELFAEVTSAAPYAALARKDFDDVVSFVESGGYALRAYDRWRRLFRDSLGRYQVLSPRVAQRYRMNIGTIVESPMLKVMLGRGRVLGEVEESFAQGLLSGDTFVFSGELLRFHGIRETFVETSRATGGGEPKVPAYVGGRLPLTTHLAQRVRQILADPAAWRDLPPSVQEWLRLQRWRSVLPERDELLVETFPRDGHEYLVAYCFEGRNAHQTLGMLLTRRMERTGLKPLGFVATDYVLAVWSLEPARRIDALLDEDMLGDDLEAWMAESSMLRRSFRNVAVIAGLIERSLPGADKTRRQVTVSSDLIYDVLRKHEPDHLLLRATRADAATGLTDVRRLGEMLKRIKGRIAHRRLDRVSPLAVPVLLEIGREEVYGSALDALLDRAAEALIAEATGAAPPSTPAPERASSRKKTVTQLRLF